MDKRNTESGLDFSFENENIRVIIESKKEDFRNEDGAAPFSDLALNREDAEDVLEAAMAHTPDENGEILLEGLLGRNWVPGFFHIAGYLYYADEAGNLLRDADDGSFHFLPDGRYTSGDEELDAMVAELLAGWDVEEGKKMLSNHHNNCYGYARCVLCPGPVREECHSPRNELRPVATGRERNNQIGEHKSGI